MSVSKGADWKFIEMEERPRRLYCLTCGKGAFIPLPALTFVSNHIKDHNIEKEEIDEAFLVVDRGDDTFIRLADSLDVLLDDKALKWGGAKVNRG